MYAAPRARAAATRPRKRHGRARGAVTNASLFSPRPSPPRLAPLPPRPARLQVLRALDTGPMWRSLHDYRLPPAMVYIDAAGWGHGAWRTASDVGRPREECTFADVTLALPTEKAYADYDINAREALTVLYVLRRWGHAWRGRVLVIRCDNAAAVAALNASTAGADAGRLRHVLRLVFRAAYACDVRLAAAHVPGVENGIADALSRDDSARARTLWEQGSVA